MLSMVKVNAKRSSSSIFQSLQLKVHETIAKLSAFGHKKKIEPRFKSKVQMVEKEPRKTECLTKVEQC